MQMTIDIRGYQNIERHINFMLDFLGPGQRLSNVSFTENGSLIFAFSEIKGKSFCKAFSKTHEVTRRIKRKGKVRATKVKRGYDSIEEAKATCKRGLTKKHFSVVKELEHENGWLIFYTR